MNFSKWMMSGLVVVSTSAVALPAIAAEGHEGGHAPSKKPKADDDDGHAKPKTKAPKADKLSAEKCVTLFQRIGKPLKAAFDKAVENACAKAGTEDADSGKSSSKGAGKALCSVVSKDGKVNQGVRKGFTAANAALAKVGLQNPYKCVGKLGPCGIGFGESFKGLIIAPGDKMWISTTPAVSDTVNVHVWRTTLFAKAKPAKNKKGKDKKDSKAKKPAKSPKKVKGAAVDVKVCTFESMDDRDKGCSCVMKPLAHGVKGVHFHIKGTQNKFVQVFLNGQGLGLAPYTIKVGPKAAVEANGNGAEAQEETATDAAATAEPTDATAAEPAAETPPADDDDDDDAAAPAATPGESPAAPTAPAPAPAETPGE